MFRRLFQLIEALFAFAAVIIVMLVCVVLLCMLFPKVPASDWPAWVQAIGSVGAILVSVGVAAYQNWASKKESRQLRKDRNANSMLPAILTIDMLRHDIINTSGSLKGYLPTSLVELLLSSCETTQRHLEQVNLGDFSISSAYDVAVARRILSDVVSILYAAKSGTGANRGATFVPSSHDVFFDRAKKDIDDILGKLRIEYKELTNQECPELIR